MRTFIVAIFAIVITYPFTARAIETQNSLSSEAESFELLSTSINPKEGDYFVYEYTKSRVDSGKPVDSGQSPVRIEIQEVNDQGTTLSYRQIIEIPAGFENTPSADLLRAGDYVILVHADPSWELIEIINFDEIHPKLIELAELLIQQQSVGQSQEIKAAIRNGIMGMFEDPEIAYSIIYKQIGLFFLGAGWEGYEGSEQIIESELPNPIGGPPLPAKLGITLSKGKSADATEMIYTQRFDKESVSENLKSIMTSFTQRAGVKNPGIDWDPNDLNIADDAVYVINSSNQFVESAEFVRTIEMMDQGRLAMSRIESYIWEFKESGNVSEDDREED